jgi:hypothetical protein
MTAGPQNNIEVQYACISPCYRNKYGLKHKAISYVLDILVSIRSVDTKLQAREMESSFLV